MLDFKERLQQLWWIGHGYDSDAELATLYDLWLLNSGPELFETSAGSSSIIPPPRMHVYLVFVDVIVLLYECGDFVAS